MIFRQMSERESSTYGYLLARRAWGEAHLIDPVKEEIPKDLQLFRELDARLVHPLDTHVHADHVTALGAPDESLLYPGHDYKGFTVGAAPASAGSSLPCRRAEAGVGGTP